MILPAMSSRKKFGNEHSLGLDTLNLSQSVDGGTPNLMSSGNRLSSIKEIMESTTKLITSPSSY